MGEEGSLEEHLLKALKFGGLAKENLTDLVRVVLRFDEKGIRPGNVHVVGIPAPDGVQIRTVLDAHTLQALVTHLPEWSRIHQFEVFPLGIPAIDRFVTDITIR